MQDNLCVTDSICSGGLCVASSAAAFVNCNDNDLCTTDSCDPNVGCMYSPLDAGLCDDDDPCTENDYCDDGVCISGENICPAQCGNGDCQVTKGESCGSCPRLRPLLEWMYNKRLCGMRWLWL